MLKTASATAVGFMEEMLGETIMHALADDQITEIMVNADGKIWLESRREGMVQRGALAPQQAHNFLSQLAQYRGEIINAHNPYLEALLPFNRERLEGTIPPISDAASFTIRKPAKEVYTLDDYIEKGIMTAQQRDAINAAVRAKKNIIVSGGPGTGKTTLCNAIIETMTHVCSPTERILMLEDIAELQCQMQNVLSLLTSDQVSMTTLLKIAMRSRPDRIFVGEVRDGAALTLLKAWNTGCPGGIATVHANSAAASLQRLQDLACEVVRTAPTQLITQAVDVMINIVRCPDHPAGRQLTPILSLKGYVERQYLTEPYQPTEEGSVL